MAPPLDIAGQRFGCLVALEWSGRSAKRGRFWRCRCDCGANTEVRIDRLRSGRTRSCGCRERMTHGLSEHPLYQTWSSMHGRCKPTAECHQFYFDRGIHVCAEWTGPVGLRVFITYVEANLGPKPTSRHTLDRVDNDRSYEPGNIRWATQSEQICNQRHAKRKLNETAVRDIRAQHAAGVSLAALGRQYNVTANSVRSIVHRKTWTYVTDATEEVAR